MIIDRIIEQTLAHNHKNAFDVIFFYHFNKLKLKFLKLIFNIFRSKSVKFFSLNSCKVTKMHPF